MSGHFKNVCENGYVHGQCRCPSRNKIVREVECNNPNHQAAVEHAGSSWGAKPKPEVDNTEKILRGIIRTAVLHAAGGDAEAIKIADELIPQITMMINDAREE